MKKNMIWMIVSGLILVGVVGGVMISQQKSKVVDQPQKKEEVGAIPTVDASTKVEAEFFNNQKELQLTVKGMPQSTESIEVQVMYNTTQNIEQGTLSSIDVKTGMGSKITLGTCSSGRCVYHEVEGPIKVTLKFTGKYGEKVLTKEFLL